jgi:hypothetical protein
MSTLSLPRNSRKGWSFMRHPLLLLLAVAACSNEGFPGPPKSGTPNDTQMQADAPEVETPLSVPILRVVPGDGWTDVKENPEIRFESGNEVSSTLLERVAETITLRASKGGGAIPLDLVLTGGQPSVARIEVNPQAALEEGWHILEVGPLERDLWPGHPEAKIDPEGRSLSRFYVGSYPSVLRVTVCQSEGLRSKLELEFSEEVELTAPVAAHIAVNGVGANCAPRQGQLMTTVAAFDCSDLSKTDLEISLQDAFSSRSVAWPQGASARFIIGASQFSPWTGGCKRYAPCRDRTETTVPFNKQRSLFYGERG